MRHRTTQKGVKRSSAAATAPRNTKVRAVQTSQPCTQ